MVHTVCTVFMYLYSLDDLQPEGMRHLISSLISPLDLGLFFSP